MPPVGAQHCPSDWYAFPHVLHRTWHDFHIEADFPGIVRAQAMASERVIENNIIRNQAVLGFTGAPFIRRCRAGRGYGVVDLLFLPADGPHDVVLVEAKRASSADAMSKVVGQLLLYCAGLARFGSDGLDLLRQFAVKSSQKARSLKPKLLKGLSGGITPPEAAWAAMQSGEQVQKSKIALWIALDARPPGGLKDVVAMLANDHSLRIGVVSVLGRDNLEVWSPSNHQRKSAKKADWQTKKLPSKHTSIALDRRFAPHEIQHLKAGLIPEEMEDKWFIYWQDDTLFFHRSWTGFCLYVVHFAKDGEWYRMCKAEVNRNPKQYTETSDAKDASLISYLIDVLLLHKKAEFPANAADSAETAVAEWGQVGRAMLGQHPAANEDAEPGVGADS